MQALEGFILVGGESRRMGKDKANLTFHGDTFVRRLADQLRNSTSKVSVVGQTTSASNFDLPTFPDIYPRWGALGGVHAALSACAAEWAFVLACDFPFVRRELLDHLANLRPGFEAVAPIQRDSIPQPLCALYRVEPCLSQAEALIKSGERKPIALLQSVETRWVSFEEISHLPGANNFFDNINTPEDYARITSE